MDIWRYLGCLMYIGGTIESKHKRYWSLIHKLSKFLGLKRFEQIHRYFTLQKDRFSIIQTDELFT
jgi:hypothetical protein